MLEEQRLNIMQSYLDRPVDSLFKLRSVFHKWFKYEDETFLDLCLAVMVHTHWLKDKDLTPLWLFISAPSGDRKSETIRAFETAENAILVNQITENSLVSGWKKQAKNDLAPKLNRKCALTYDFGQFLKMNGEQKGKIWSQMRSAFDGYVIRHTGSGVDTAYKGLRWNWILGTTPLIDGELIMKDELGTRELMFKMSDENIEENIEKIQQKVWENQNDKEVMRLELTLAVNSFMDSWRKRNVGFDDVQVSEETKSEIFLYARFMALLRANAEVDPYTGELTSFVHPEKPTRNLEQLKGLFLALKSLSPCYTDKLALKRLESITQSSICEIRLAVLKELIKNRDLSEQYVPVGLGTLRKRLKLGAKTITRELMILAQLEFVDYIEEGHQGTQGEFKSRKWFINTDENNKKIIDFVLKEGNDNA
jgi:hypothetical protein